MVASPTYSPTESNLNELQVTLKYQLSYEL